MPCLLRRQVTDSEVCLEILSGPSKVLQLRKDDKINKGILSRKIGYVKYKNKNAQKGAQEDKKPRRQQNRTLSKELGKIFKTAFDCVALVKETFSLVPGEQANF